jgi:hypothetical protein
LKVEELDWVEVTPRCAHYIKNHLVTCNQMLDWNLYDTKVFIFEMKIVFPVHPRIFLICRAWLEFHRLGGIDLHLRKKAAARLSIN